ncbi:MAG TPA: toxin-antitoxin system HicB family antitoxin [Marmoricola sp.]|nr:toxin-antitoxin system HicB family antitoxin [Marmoricola sp.]
MDITPYVERLRQDLAQAAGAGDQSIREAAERLALSVDASMRLALMEALSEATAEITTEMRTGSVEVRLSGRELEFVVNQGAAAAPQPAASPPADVDDDEDAATARITLRLPENIKSRAEELAAKGGHSLNTWIVNVLRAATREHAVTVDIDLSSLPFLDRELPGGRRGGRRMTGWI